MNTTDEKSNISVLICVYNGGELFKKSIESVCRLKIPEKTRMEFLFVDNNSTDDTRSTIKEYVRKYPETFRYLFEPKAGKSHALNLAIREARGEILAFTDADIILSEDWLLRIREGFEKYDCVALGGRVLLILQAKPPRWMRKDFRAGKGYFGFDADEEMRYYSKGAPLGNNSAVKKDCIDKYGGFRTDLGPRPGVGLNGDDTEFFRRLLKNRKKVFYYPAMTAYHQIPKECMTKESAIRENFLSALSGLRGRTEPTNVLKVLSKLPETVFKIILSGFGCDRLTSLSTVRYVMRLHFLLYTLSYRFTGEKNTIRLAKIFGLIDKIQKNELLNSVFSNDVPPNKLLYHLKIRCPQGKK